MNVSITKRLEFDAGHRLLRHEGQCRNVHGHRYAAEFILTATKLDSVGRVVDFGVVKATMGEWISRHLDHAFIYQKGDPIAAWLKKHRMKAYAMHHAPTAENIAALLAQAAIVSLAVKGVTLLAVKLYETPTSSATWRRSV